MFLLVKESINQPLSKLLRSAPRRSLEAPIESAGGEVPNQWVKWGKYDIWFLPISPISMANGKCQIYWHIIFKSLGVFLGGVEGLLVIYGLLLGKKERSLWMGKYKKNDDVVLGGYVSLVFIDFHRQDFEAAGRYLDSDWRTSLRWFSFKWFICVWLTYENGYVHRFSIAMSIYVKNRRVYNHYCI